MRKPLIAIIAACALCLGLLSACGGQASSASSAASGSAAASASSSETGKIKVVCATFPAYDWTMNVVGDNADAYDVTYLMGQGVDLHSYQPSIEDIAKIADADLFVYVGGESDKWAEDAVKTVASEKLHTVSMLKAVGDAAVEEEVVEGMQADEHDHDHDAASGEAAEAGSHDAADGDHAAESAEAEGHDHDAASGEAAEAEGHDHESAEAAEYDEHVWLSLRNAQVLVDAIASELSAIDASNADTYAENAKAYKAELSALDGRYAEAVKAASKDTVVFADRFPFRYLVDDYGLKYYAAFVGCSAETEASFETVAFLAQKLDELGLSHVFVIEKSDQKIAETVIANTQGKDQTVLVMDSLQSATDDDIAAGKTYLSAMEDNLSSLKTALA